MEEVALLGPMGNLGHHIVADRQFGVRLVPHLVPREALQILHGPAVDAAGHRRGDHPQEGHIAGRVPHQAAQQARTDRALVASSPRRGQDPVGLVGSPVGGSAQDHHVGIDRADDPGQGTGHQ